MPDRGRGRCGRESGRRSYPAGPASTISSFETTSITRHKTPVIIPPTRTRCRKSTRRIAPAAFRLRSDLGLAHASAVRHAWQSRSFTRCAGRTAGRGDWSATYGGGDVPASADLRSTPPHGAAETRLERVFRVDFGPRAPRRVDRHWRSAGVPTAPARWGGGCARRTPPRGSP